MPAQLRKIGQFDVNCLLKKYHELRVTNCTAHDIRNAAFGNTSKESGNVSRCDKPSPFAKCVENGLYCSRQSGQRFIFLALNSAKAVRVTEIWLERVDALENV